MAKPAVALKLVRDKTPEINKDLDALATKYGLDLFRLVGQRYFKNVMQQRALEREIEEKKRQLAWLERKAGR